MANKLRLLKRFPALIISVLAVLVPILTTDLASGYLFWDFILQLLVILAIVISWGSTGGLVGSHLMPWQYSPWYFMQLSLTCATYAFAYIGQGSHTYLPHVLFAGLRLGFCVASLIAFVYFRIHVRTGSVASFILISVLIAALLHFKLACDRLQEYRKRQDEVYINPSDYRMNQMTGEAMHYSHVTDRDQHRGEAIDAVTATPEDKRFWYHPIVAIDNKEHSLPLGRGADFQTPYFSRCYCCLGSDPPPATSSSLQVNSPPNEDTELLNRQSQWQDQRELFLRQPPQGHPLIIPRPLEADGITRLGKEIEPHYLCEKCTFMAQNSDLIELQSGWNMHTYRKLLSQAFKREAFVEECFEHWPTPSEMEFQVKKMGCHLCTMVWNTMSEEQQQELLARDSLLEQELNELLSNEHHDQVQLEGIREYYHKQRCIQMKIRSPWAHREWAGAWKSRHSRRSLRLVPHLGGKRVAQRWMEQKLAWRAISLDEDPVLEWDMEQDDGLEIVSMGR